MKQNITMQDIADRFGVSKVTVSKALNDKEGVSDSLKEKIQEAATEMGYRMNVIARSLKENATYNIGVIIAEHFTTTGDIHKTPESNSFYMNFYQEISKVLSMQRYSAILYILTEEDEHSQILPSIYMENKVDGLIILGQVNDDYVTALSETDVPLVFLDFYDELVDTDSITTDNFDGCYSLTNYLIREGHRKIAYVGNIYFTSSIQDRYLGYYKSLLEHRMDLRMDYVINDRNDRGEFVTIEYPKDMPTAFVCNCDQVANLVIRDLKRLGYKVPEDISVAGFDNSIYSSLSEPTITTVEVDTANMSQAAVDLLLKKIEGKQYAAGKQAIKGRLIIKESVRSL